MSLSDSCVRPVDGAVADVDRVVRRTALTGVGAFRCPPSHPRFGDSGPIRNHCFVFPRTTSRIEHDRGGRFIADPTVVSLYNAGQAYRRAVVSPEGDYCDYFVVASSVLRDALAHAGITRGDRDEAALFGRAYVRSDARLYARQRVLFRQARTGSADDLEIESGVCGLLARVVAAHGDGRDRSMSVSVQARRKVEEVRQFLAVEYTQPASLEALARRVEMSPYHLSRVFRSITGYSMHQYRLQLRLRAALSRLSQGQDLTTLALDLGFSSHSHFTATFRRVFGHPPSAWR